MKKIFSIYLGGYAPKCLVEVHDMVFAVGCSFDEILPQLKDKWFLNHFDRFHYDGYQDLSVVDGHRIQLQDAPSDSPIKLFYVHLGAYDQNQLNELHKNCFVVASSIAEAKSKARASWTSVDQPHKDVQCDVESLIQIDEVDGLFLHLEPTTDSPDLNLHLGYNLIS